MKRTGRMRTSQPHWLPFACNKRLGPRTVVQNGLGRVGMERTVPLMGLEEAAHLKREFSHRLVAEPSAWSSSLFESLSSGSTSTHRTEDQHPVDDRSTILKAQRLGDDVITHVFQVRPSVVDDFIRNFLIKVGLTRTLDSFNTEWYELQAKGRLGEEYTTKVPDIYLRNEELDEQVISALPQTSWVKTLEIILNDRIAFSG